MNIKVGNERFVRTIMHSVPFIPCRNKLIFLLAGMHG